MRHYRPFRSSIDHRVSFFPLISLGAPKTFPNLYDPLIWKILSPLLSLLQRSNHYFNKIPNLAGTDPLGSYHLNNLNLRNKPSFRHNNQLHQSLYLHPLLNDHLEFLAPSQLALASSFQTLYETNFETAGLSISHSHT